MNKPRLLNRLALGCSLAIMTMASGCAFAQTTNPPPVIGQQPGNVLYVTTNGIDATAKRGNAEKPFATISAAISAAQPGDRIDVGVGTFAGNTGTLTLPDQVVLRGCGTNSTICDINDLKLGHSNEVCGISFTNRAGLIGQGQIRSYSNSGQDYIHDVLVLSQNQCLTLSSVDGNGGGLRGWNVISNCTFDTKAFGIQAGGTNFFYNCAIQKLSDNSSVTSGNGTMLLGVFSGLNGYLYWSGGSLLSTTNSGGGGPATNNWAVWNGTSPSLVYLQNATISTPSGGEEIFGTAGNTNYIASLTWTPSKTNLAAIIVSNAPPLFPNTNSMAWKFQAGSWHWGSQSTNAPGTLTNTFWIP